MKSKNVIIISIIIIIIIIINSVYIIFKNVYIKNNINNNTNPKVEENNLTNEKNNYVSYNGWLQINDNTLVNQYGEKIQLKGISTHGIQWFSEFANIDTISQLKNDWHSNLFRIAMYTDQSGYLTNKDLKEKVKEIANIAINQDMYVIIDWHILNDGNPQSHINEAKEFFNEISNIYKDSPNIIYEICNEPNGNVNWNDNIKPYAEEIIDVIRKNSPKSIIVVGTSTWCQDIDQAANNPINQNNIMYSLHFYSGTHTSWLRERAKETIKKIPLFVTEWGTSNASGNGGVYLDEAKLWLQFMKENNISWANWSLSNKNETSALLIPNSPTNSISDQYLSESGKFVKEAIKN